MSCGPHSPLSHFQPHPNASSMAHLIMWHPWLLFMCKWYLFVRECPCFFKLPTMAKEATIQHELLRLAPSPRILSIRLSNMDNHVRWPEAPCEFLPASLSKALYVWNSPVHMHLPWKPLTFLSVLGQHLTTRSNHPLPLPPYPLTLLACKVYHGFH